MLIGPPSPQFWLSSMFCFLPDLGNLIHGKALSFEAPHSAQPWCCPVPAPDTFASDSVIPFDAAMIFFLLRCNWLCMINTDTSFFKLNTLFQILLFQLALWPFLWLLHKEFIHLW